MEPLSHSHSQFHSQLGSDSVSLSRSILKKSDSPPALIPAANPRPAHVSVDGEDDVEADDGDSDELSSLELLQLCVPVIPSQLGWAISEALIIPYLISLGVDETLANAIWVINPIAGVFLQPAIGAFSDRCNSSWGRRRPFLLFFHMGIIVGMLLIAFAPEIHQLIWGTDGLSDRGFGSTSLLVIVFSGCVIMELSNDFLTIPSRALLNDQLPESQLEQGNSLFASMSSFGAVIGLVLCFLPLQKFYPLSLLTTQLRATFVTCIVLIFISNFMTMSIKNDINWDLQEWEEEEGEAEAGQPSESQPLLAQSYTQNATDHANTNTNANDEENPKNENNESIDDEEEEESGGNAMVDPDHLSFSQSLLAFRLLPPELTSIWICQLTFWLPIMQVSFWWSTWCGVVVFSADPIEEKDRFYEGVNFGIQGSLVQSVVSFFASQLLPYVNNRFGVTRVYHLSAILFSFATMALWWYRDQYSAVAYMIFTGLLYPVINSNPFILIEVYTGVTDEDGEEETEGNAEDSDKPQLPSSHPQSHYQSQALPIPDSIAHSDDDEIAKLVRSISNDAAVPHELLYNTSPIPPSNLHLLDSYSQSEATMSDTSSEDEDEHPSQLPHSQLYQKGRKHKKFVSPSSGISESESESEAELPLQRRSLPSESDSDVTDFDAPSRLRSPPPALTVPMSAPGPVARASPTRLPPALEPLPPVSSKAQRSIQFIGSVDESEGDVQSSPESSPETDEKESLNHVAAFLKEHRPDPANAEVNAATTSESAENSSASAGQRAGLKISGDEFSSEADPDAEAEEEEEEAEAAAELSASRNRGVLTAIMNLSMGLSQVISATLGGAIISYYGDITIVFVLSSILCLGVNLAVLLRQSAPEEEAEPEAAEPTQPETVPQEAVPSESDRLLEERRADDARELKRRRRQLRQHFERNVIRELLQQRKLGDFLQSSYGKESVDYGTFKTLKKMRKKLKKVRLARGVSDQTAAQHSPPRLMSPEPFDIPTGSPPVGDSQASPESAKSIARAERRAARRRRHAERAEMAEVLSAVAGQKILRDAVGLLHQFHVEHVQDLPPNLQMQLHKRLVELLLQLPRTHLKGVDASISARRGLSGRFHQGAEVKKERERLNIHQPAVQSSRSHAPQQLPSAASAAGSESDSKRRRQQRAMRNKLHQAAQAAGEQLSRTP